MSKPTYYKQCKLRKSNLSLLPDDYDIREQVTYLPVQHAIVGSWLRLRNESGSWDNGWLVIEVYGEPILEDRLPDYRLSIRGHLKNTGDNTDPILKDCW